MTLRAVGIRSVAGRGGEARSSSPGVCYAYQVYTRGEDARLDRGPVDGHQISPSRSGSAGASRRLRPRSRVRPGCIGPFPCSRSGGGGTSPEGSTVPPPWARVSGLPGEGAVAVVVVQQPILFPEVLEEPGGEGLLGRGQVLHGVSPHAEVDPADSPLGPLPEGRHPLCSRWSGRRPRRRGPATR